MYMRTANLRKKIKSKVIQGTLLFGILHQYLVSLICIDAKEKIYITDFRSIDPS